MNIYYILEKGDIVQSGDELLCVHGSPCCWKPADSFENSLIPKIGKIIGEDIYPYAVRRPVFTKLIQDSEPKLRKVTVI